jgi:flagellar motility protein MotE (MotC chaperone)
MMSRRLMPYVVVCFVILGFSKLMSLLNSDSSLIEAITIHADTNTKSSSDTKIEDAIHSTVNKSVNAQNKVNIVRTDGKIVGNVYNLDTSQIQNIAVCQKLYDLNFSNDEIEILKNLRQRREAIEDRNKDLVILETALQSIQKDIEVKVAQLEKLNTQIEEKSSDGGIANGERVNKLVRIYEGMKPKDAANIFNDLQMSVLLDVAQKMKDNKLAAVVAEMQPQKARDLTMALAANRRGIDFD